LKALAHIDRTALVDEVIKWRKTPNMRNHAWAFDLKKGLCGDVDASKFHPSASKRHPDALPLHKDSLTEFRKLFNDSTNPQATPLPLALKKPFDTLTGPQVGDLAFGLNEFLNGVLSGNPPWASDIPREYDRGPAHQAPRLELVQSLLDRI
jgi:hypothetical protein